MCCKTCHVQVSRGTNPDGTEWYGHPGMNGVNGHEVVPIRLPADQVTRLCDFCMAPGPTWIFPLLDRADTTKWHPGLGINVTALDTDGWWTACETCTELINTRQIGKLRDRALQVGQEVLERPLSSWEKQSIITQLGAFWTHSPGSPVEISTLE